MAQRLRIFISSPGDVPDERLRADLIVDKLGQDYGREQETLDKYVKKADNSFAWKLVRTRETAQAKIYDIELTSQTWHGIVWKHDLQVFVPAGAKPGSTWRWACR